MRRWDCGDEELGTIRVDSRVGHTQQEGFVVLEIEAVPGSRSERELDLMRTKDSLTFRRQTCRRRYSPHPCHLQASLEGQPICRHERERWIQMYILTSIRKVTSLDHEALYYPVKL